MAHHRLSPEVDFDPPIQSSITRVSSSASTPLRHPTPDLQSLQGAYIGNIERLEQTAERLSVGSDISEELRKLKLEQKRSESRRSSLITSALEEEASPPHSRQFSYGYGSHASGSIVGMNTIARSGGFSPGGYFASPRSSIRSGSWSRRNSIKGRSASNGSRFAQVVEATEGTKSSDMPSVFTPTIAPASPFPKVLRITNDDDISTNSAKGQHSPDVIPPELAEHTQDVPVRPKSADTYQQAQAAGLFSDFDGVHTCDQPPDSLLAENDTSKREINGRTPSGGRPQSYMEPVPGENMVYYPAPVPMILNLPQKLSKQPSAPQRAKRRSELLSGLPPNARKSGAWLPNLDELGDGRESYNGEQMFHEQSEKHRATAGLPPQLRASLFFDYPATHNEVEIKEGSAVKTLDSILDASAFAPVSAFTDHPIVGHVGKEVYGKSPTDRRISSMPTEILDHQERKSSTNVLKKRISSSGILDEAQNRSTSFLGLTLGKRKTSAPQENVREKYVGIDAGNLPTEETPLQDRESIGEDLEEGEYFDAQEDVVGDNAENESELIDEYSGQPTTLLAELQLRKQELKQRNRTAALAFPNGMHSTLLELDAVAQIQKRSRQNEQTTLAWEDANAAHPNAQNDDEDVPLGVLFPRRKANLRGLFNEDKPIGLIAQRDMEDNEPLSRRRARLRGEPSPQRTSSLDRKGAAYTPDFLGDQDPNPRNEAQEVEGETLAQRLRRLKAEKQMNEFASGPAHTVSGDFASEMMSQFGAVEDSKNHKNSSKPGTPTPELENETLAQRRARLQAERSRDVSGESHGNFKPQISKRRSMADLLQAHPAAGAGVRQFSNDKVPLPSSATPKTPWTMKVQQRALSRELPLADRAEAHPYGDHYHNGISNRFAVNGFNTQESGGTNVPNPLMSSVNGNRIGSNGEGKQPTVEADIRSRDMIDRWRQSVMY
ncbi:MAG: hypothetical protein Q9190_006265 [Brigantiaea leucoxantha]